MKNICYASHLVDDGIKSETKFKLIHLLWPMTFIALFPFDDLRQRAPLLMTNMYRHFIWNQHYSYRLCAVNEAKSDSIVTPK